MTVKIEELVAELTADVSDLKRGFNIASKEAKKTSDKITRSMVRTEKSFAKMGKAARLIGPAIAAIAGAAIVRGIASSIIEYEKMQASLVTVTGSAENAASAFSKIQRFTATTPFQITEVTNAFIKLKALGLDPSEDALRSYGNTASAMGKSLNQFIEAIADASTGEFERLKEFGIKARTEGDKIKFRFKGLTTTVGNNAGEIEGFLRNLGKVEFAGAMERQMDTLGGAVSNMGDSFFRLATVIGEAGLSKALTKVTRAIIGATNAISDFIETTDTERLVQVNRRIAEIERSLTKLGDADVNIDEEFGIVELNEELEEQKRIRDGLTKTIKNQTKVQKDNTAEVAKARANAEKFDKSLQKLRKTLGSNILKQKEAEETTETLDKALFKGKITFEEWEELSSKAAGTYKDNVDTMVSDTDRLVDAIQGWGREFTDTFTDALTGADVSFGDLLKSMARDLIRMQVQTKITDPLFGTGKSRKKGGGGGILGDIFSGVKGIFGFQGGGQVTAGEPILVGERRPEIFVPDSPGRIQSRVGGGGGGSSINLVQNFNISTGVSQTVRAELLQLMPTIQADSKAAVLSAINQGGSFARAVGRKS